MVGLVRPCDMPDFARRRGPAAILLGDQTLTTAYLLSHPGAGDSANLSDEQAARFLLWFAIEGRRRYQHVVFSPSYLAFLAEPVAPYPTRLSAYVLLSRPDLLKSFGNDIARMAAWYRHEGATELGLAPLLSVGERTSTNAVTPRDDRSDLPGVNIVGFGNNVMGIGEDVRALAATLNRVGVHHAVINTHLSEAFGTTVQAAQATPQSDRPLFPVTVFALPPFETARLFVEQGAQLFHRRYNIGYWPWELTTLPELARGAFDLVDEIWASSAFLVDVYSSLTRKPVVLIPPYLNIPEPAPFDLTRYGVAPGDFVCLTMFDFNSFVARKNPQGAIAAFRSAFTDGAAKLVLKTINAHARPDETRALEALCAGDSRCIVIHDTLSRRETVGLIAQVDCLLSLHRAEGFGRIIAEAMALGTSVVATDWSGSASFLDRTRGYPVLCTLRDVAAGEYIYHHGSRWAEPSIADAAARLRETRENDARDDARQQRAKVFMASRYGLDTVAHAVTDRLEKITAHRPDLVA